MVFFLVSCRHVYTREVHRLLPFNWNFLFCNHQTVYSLRSGVEFASRHFGLDRLLGWDFSRPLDRASVIGLAAQILLVYMLLSFSWCLRLAKDLKHHHRVQEFTEELYRSFFLSSVLSFIFVSLRGNKRCKFDAVSGHRPSDKVLALFAWIVEVTGRVTALEMNIKKCLKMPLRPTHTRDEWTDELVNS